jgi:hypothetical protein
MNEAKIGKSQLRSFALIVAAGFGVIGVLPLVIRGQSVRWWAVVIAAAMLLTGLILPQVLRPVFKVWMFVGAILGWINTRVILCLLYYGLIVPIGIARRLTGKDSMLRSFDRGVSSYRIPRDKRPASHMHHQY